MNIAVTLDVLDDWYRADIRAMRDRVPPTLDEWDRAIKQFHRAESRFDVVFGVKQVYPRLPRSLAPSQSLLTLEEQATLHIVVPESI